jgi:hypothetical protein
MGLTLSPGVMSGSLGCASMAWKVQLTMLYSMD